jgi:hypothetical protein
MSEKIDILVWRRCFHLWKNSHSFGVISSVRKEHTKTTFQLLSNVYFLHTHLYMGDFFEIILEIVSPDFELFLHQNFLKERQSDHSQPHLDFQIFPSSRPSVK